MKVDFLVGFINLNALINPSCTKEFGTHAFYGEGGGGG